MDKVEKRKLVIARGLPGSGKSTFAVAWVNDSPDTRTRLNRDIIRFNYYGAYVGETVSELGVTEIEHAIAKAIMSRGERDLVIDNTNTKHKNVIPYLLMAIQYDYEVEFVDFNVPVEELIRRDAARDRSVGEAVIRSFADRYYQKGVLIPPPKITLD